MAEWYYAIDGKQVGPVTEEQVRGVLGEGQAVLVWREGMGRWTPAEEVAEFAARAVPVAEEVMVLAEATPVLSYRVQSEVAYSQEVAEDRGPFVKIGGQMSLGGDRWTGVCFGSPQAFYLLKKSRMASQTGFLIGGVAGALIAAAAQSDEQVRTCEVAELPPGVRAGIDPKGKLGKCDVVVLPKEAITVVKMSRWGGAVKIQVGAEQYSAVTGAFSYGRVRRGLEEMGWQMGMEMTPTIDAPVRRGLKPGQKRTAGWLKALYIVLGILLIVAIVVLRALLG